MKIAISGKGGAGKTLLAAMLSKIFAESGYSVIAIDGAPHANLVATFGFTPMTKHWLMLTLLIFPFWTPVSGLWLR